eukprot:14538739-Ditylum_brightwellii.AAC.1
MDKCASDATFGPPDTPLFLSRRLLASAAPPRGGLLGGGTESRLRRFFSAKCFAEDGPGSRSG